MDVQLPDGTIIRGIPDGTSQADLTAKLARNGYDVSKLAAPAPSAPNGQRNLSDLITGRAAAPAPLSRTDKVLQGMMDPINGGAQLLERGVNSIAPGLVRGINQANNWLADKTGLVGRLPEGGVDQMTREQNTAYETRRTAQGESGFDGYRTIGNAASPANLAIAARAPAAASLIGRMASGAAVGATSGLLNPVTGGDDYLTEKAKQVGLGAATGGTLPAIASGLGRIISPNASKNANVALLREEGVRPTIGQTLGGWANKAEEKLQSVPIMGDMISSARKSANSDFERAAFDRALKPIGQKLPAGVTGRDAVVATENALKDSYDEVLGKIGAIRPDAAFTSKVDNLKTMVKGMLMPPAEKAKFTSALNDINASLDANGYMTSEAYKMLESSLGTDARKLAASTNIYEGKVSGAVKQLQAELRDMLNRQAGDSAAELKAVNAGWANFKLVQNAAGKVGAEDGNFSPAQFQNAVRTMDKSKDKGAFARGNALGQDLGDAGKAVLGDKVRDSGTAGRLMLGGGAVGAGFANPAIPLALAGGGAMYLSPVQRALVASVTSRPQSADAIAEILRKNAAMLGGAGAPVGAGLLAD